MGNTREEIILEDRDKLQGYYSSVVKFLTIYKQYFGVLLTKKDLVHLWSSEKNVLEIHIAEQMHRTRKNPFLPAELYTEKIELLKRVEGIRAVHGYIHLHGLTFDEDGYIIAIKNIPESDLKGILRTDKKDSLTSFTEDRTSEIMSRNTIKEIITK
jgi:hypothetical protein